MRNAIAIILAFWLTACGPAQKLADFGTTITKTITNPVSSVDIYRIKNVYAATLQGFIDYRAYCWGKPFAALMADPIAKPVCEHRRAVVRKVQQARPKVAASIKVADNFVRDNPSLSATSVLDAAWNAVNDFRNLVPVVK